MRRIGLAIGLIVSLALAPLAGVAQQAGKVYRIGFLSNQTPGTITAALNAFRQKLRDLGYAEGRNLAIE
jgi:putative tryptophan/tyrosine transport system substrate-binding protein